MEAWRKGESTEIKGKLIQFRQEKRGKREIRENKD